MTSYTDTVVSLLGILAQANSADSEYRQLWQRLSDTSITVNLVTKLLLEIGAGPALNQWLETNEVDTQLTLDVIEKCRVAVEVANDQRARMDIVDDVFSAEDEYYRCNVRRVIPWGA